MPSDTDAAALYDLLNPWDPDRQAEDRFYPELRASLTAIREALCPGGRFAFETRYPQARAWEEWSQSNPDDVVDLVDDAGRLRFLGVAALNLFLTEAGFEIEAQYGDWHRGPSTDDSREIITIARRR